MAIDRGARESRTAIRTECRTHAGGVRVTPVARWALQKAHEHKPGNVAEFRSNLDKLGGRFDTVALNLRNYFQP